MSRGGRIVGVVAALLLALAGCATPNAPARAPAGGGAFPVTIPHKYGSTTVPAEPRRVVALGYQEHDFVLALGVVPVGVRWWYGPEDDVLQPWAEPAAGGAKPQIIKADAIDSVALERIAALQPDLVLGLYSGITQDEYAQLSKIAPTVPQSGDYHDYGSPWQVTTRTIGTALGRGAEAEKLVTDLDARFAAIRNAHPEFAGKSVVVATYGADQLGFFASQDPRARFFTSLGFTVDKQFDDIAGSQFYGDLSFEQMGLLDRDLIVWDQLSFTPGGRATVAADPLVQRLAAAREGRQVFLEGEVETAFGWNTVLSLPYALDGIEPLLTAAVKGDR